MTISKYQFRTELRQLIEKYITSSSTFEDYVIATEELEEAKNRLDDESDKFSDEEVDACDV